MIPISLSFSNTGRAPMFLSAIKAMASNTVAVGAIDHTVDPFRARIPLIVPAIFMIYLRPGGGRIQKQSGDL
jgi:hypothetical protein